MERRKLERRMWLALMAAVLVLAAGAEFAQAQVLPDLMVTLVNGPDTGTIGGLRPTIKVSITVTNQSTTGAGPFDVGFYYSTVPNVTTGDIFSGYICPFPTGLLAGQSIICNGKIKAPKTMAPGTYYLGACADYKSQVAESNENNNCNADSMPIVLSTGGR